MINKLIVLSRKFRCDIAVVGETLFVVASFLNVFSFTALQQRFVVDATPSMLVGVYEITNKPITRGVIVGACVPESYATLAKQRNYVGSASCSNGLRPVMKHVAALPGDEIVVGIRGVSVNGESIANTRVLSSDANGQSLPNQRGRHSVGKKQYWLISNTDIGCFDSRYFGPVSETLGVVEPLITRSTLCKTQIFSHLIRCSGDSR